MQCIQSVLLCSLQSAYLAIWTWHIQPNSNLFVLAESNSLYQTRWIQQRLIICLSRCKTLFKISDLPVQLAQLPTTKQPSLRLSAGSGWHHSLAATHSQATHSQGIHTSTKAYRHTAKNALSGRCEKAIRVKQLCYFARIWLKRLARSLWVKQTV